MSSFYAAHRPVAGAAMQTKAEAIRSAQLAMIRGTLPAVPAAGGASQARGGDTSGDGQRGDVQGPKTRAAAAEDYRHPYYWAPFVLMGNWL
jgi:CHAT domain-containing protein